MNKKRGILLLGFIVIVSGWWMTSGGSSARPEAGVLDVWATWGDQPDQLQALLGRYSESGGAPVRVTTRLRDDDLLEALAGGEPPDMVVLSSVDLVAAAGDGGLVEPLDRWIEATEIDLDDFFPAPLEGCRSSEGTTLCLPWGCDVPVLFWNKDLFRAAGLDPERPPRTMEELVEIADRLTFRDEKGELEQIGFIPDLTRSHTGLVAAQFGGAWADDAGTELTVNSTPMLEAANWQRQFYDRYGIREVTSLVSSLDRYRDSSHPLHTGRRLSCQQCHRATLSETARIPDRGFYDGKVAMLVAGQWEVGSIFTGQLWLELEVGVAPFPPPADHPERASTAVVEGPVVLIPAGAVDKAAAAELLAWMMAPETAGQAASAFSLLPTSRAAARDPLFQEGRFADTFVELLVHPNARPSVTTPISPELNRALRQVEDEILHEAGDPAPLLGAVQAEFAPRLKAALAFRDRP